MLSRWNDYNDPFAVLGAFRQHFDHLFDDYASEGAMREGAGPRLHLFDTKEALVMMADVPGLQEKDINLTVNQDVFTITGERKADAPEGYTPHRTERSAYRFSRSFSLPTKVDLEKTQAIVKDGVLTVTMPKAPEAQPRQISVRASRLSQKKGDSAMNTTKHDKSLARTPEQTTSRRTIAPAVDIYENKDEFLLVADLPGVTRDALQMHFDRNELRFEGVRQPPQGAQSLAAEFQPADYRRSFAVPHGIDATRIEAELHDGVLRVRLPKSEALKPRRIDVKAG